MKPKPFTCRVHLESRSLTALQSRTTAIVVTTENIEFPSFSVGQIVTINSRDKACRCEVIDYRRYTTLHGLTVGENTEAFVNTPPPSPPDHHVYVVLELVTLESINELARRKHSA